MLSFILHRWCTDLLAFSSTCWKKTHPHINFPLIFNNIFYEHLQSKSIFKFYVHSLLFIFASYIHIYDIQMAIKLNWTAVNTCYRLCLDGRIFCYFLLIDRMTAYILALFYLFKVNFSGNVFGLYDHLPSKLV